MKLNVSLVQMTVAQAEPEENLKKGERFIAEAARRGSDIICFPEMWTTGFGWAYNTRAVRDSLKIVDRVAAMAKRHRLWVTGSMLAPSPDGRPANTAFLFGPDGAVAARYDKIHLFGAIGEDRHVAAGGAPAVADTPWGKAALAVCYDIRFPELFVSYALRGALMVFVPAAFPYPKLHHWKTLIRARAIEDQFFVIAANQVGAEDLDEAGIQTYAGSSAIIDPWGEPVIEAGETEEGVFTATLDLHKAAEIRSRMHVLQDRRPELYISR